MKRYFSQPCERDYKKLFLLTRPFFFFGERK